MTGRIRTSIVKIALEVVIGWFCMAALLCAMLGYPWSASAGNAAAAVTVAAAWQALYGRQT